MIQGGETKCFNLVIRDDNLPERYERITLNLNSSNNVFRQFTTQVTIVDDDGILCSLLKTSCDFTNLCYVQCLILKSVVTLSVRMVLSSAYVLD